MASMAVITPKITRVEINQTECEALLREPGGAVWSLVERHSTVCLALAKGIAPKETGKGAASLTSNVERRSRYQVIGVVGTDVPYMRYQEKGTGPIYPKKAKALRFQPKGAQGFVFAKRTRGVPETAFLRKALQVACPGWKYTEGTGRGGRGGGRRG